MKPLLIGAAVIVAIVWFINYRQDKRTEAFHQESQRNMNEFMNGFISGWKEGGTAP